MFNNFIQTLNLCMQSKKRLVCIAASTLMLWTTSAPLAPAQSNLRAPSLVPQVAATVVKRTNAAELIQPHRRKLTFSTRPSDYEIFNSRVFFEPLVPMDDKTSTQENSDLARALIGFEQR